MYIELVFGIKYLMNLLNIIKGKNLLYIYGLTKFFKVI